MLRTFSLTSQEIILLQFLSGYDIEIEVQIENENKLRELIEEIRERFSNIIKDYEILHYYKEHRLRFFPCL